MLVLVCRFASGQTDVCSCGNCLPVTVVCTAGELPLGMGQIFQVEFVMVLLHQVVGLLSEKLVCTSGRHAGTTEWWGAFCFLVFGY
jgi:hypothetical protein